MIVQSICLVLVRTPPGTNLLFIPCRSEVPEKIVHPINYGYFTKPQPRLRFFLDKDSMAMTNQCIYLTLNQNQVQQGTPLIYFLTLLNSSTLQFFVLHFCKYDQQGRMRLFRDSMSKIPFQNQDVDSNPKRTQYASRLGEQMVELKELVYKMVSTWPLEVHHSRGLGTLPGRTSSSNQSLLDWIRKGGDAPFGVLERTREQVRMMLRTMGGSGPFTHSSSLSQSPSPSIPSTFRSLNPAAPSFVDTDTDHSTGTDTDTDTDDQVNRLIFTMTEKRQGGWTVGDRGDMRGMDLSDMGDPRPVTESQQHMLGEGLYRTRSSSAATSASEDPSTTSSPFTPLSAPLPTTPMSDISSECDRIMQAIERAVAMIEIVQWAVDQYGYMLYKISPTYQELLEVELRLVYGSVVEALVAPSMPMTEEDMSLDFTNFGAPLDTMPHVPAQAPRNEYQRRPLVSSPENPASKLGINITGLYRWDEDAGLNEPLKTAGIPLYAQSVQENAQAAAQSLQELLERYPGSRSQTE